MTNEELMRIYTADPDNAEDALVQLYEQNMDLIWDIARNSAKAFNCLNATRYSQNILEDLVSRLPQFVRTVQKEVLYRNIQF